MVWCCTVKHKRRGVIVRSRCIITRNGRILLQREENGIYSIPGGRLEFNETLPFCAVRELREEAGLHVEATRLVYVVEAIHVKKGIHKHELLFFFYCEGEGEPRPNIRSIEFHWIDPRDLDRDSFWPPGLLDRIIEDMPDFRNFYYIVYIDDRINYINKIENKTVEPLTVRAKSPYSNEASDETSS